VDRRRLALVRALRRGPGRRAGRISLDGTVDERWRGDAFIGDEVTKPKCTIADGGSVVWTTHQAHGLPPELARFDHDAGSGPGSPRSTTT
jgi:hypothetical protein